MKSRKIQTELEVMLSGCTRYVDVFPEDKGRQIRDYSDVRSILRAAFFARNYPRVIAANFQLGKTTEQEKREKLDKLRRGSTKEGA